MPNSTLKTLTRQEIKSAIIGMILGDGYLQKTGEKNARLRLEHGYKQKEYLLWKTEKLKQWIMTQ